MEYKDLNKIIVYAERLEMLESETSNKIEILNLDLRILTPKNGEKNSSPFKTETLEVKICLLLVPSCFYTPLQCDFPILDR